MVKKYLSTKLCRYYLVLYFFPVTAMCQPTSIDTVQLDIPKAEQIFLKQNLALLANHYNIDISKALVQQAAMWDNPVLNTDQNVYDGKFFRHKTVNGQAYGQVYIQVQQLIRTAGKIKKQVQLAQDNVSGAEAQFNDLMRNLKYVLATDMNNLSQLQSNAVVYKDEMQTMQALARGMDEMYKVGDISQKENIRINALLFSLQNEWADNLAQQADLEREISTLLQLDNTWIVADAKQSLSQNDIASISFSEVKDTALALRPDLAFAVSQSLFQRHNIGYQKALAKPDINIGLEYDRLSSYQPNYVGLAVSIPLPVFNKNQGNITAAKFSLAQSETELGQVKTRVNNEVTAAFQKLWQFTSLQNNNQSTLKDTYDKMMKNMTESYRSRHIGLVEYIDFFEAYKSTRMQQWELVAKQRNAAAELNYSINQNLLKL